MDNNELKEFQKVRSIFTRGAESGAPIGFMMVAAFFAMVSTGSPLMMYICVFIFLAVPYVAYKLLRRSFIKSGGRLWLLAIWLEGVFIFMFGSLLVAVAAYVFFNYLSPGYFNNLLNMGIEVYSQYPEMAEMAEVLRNAKENNLIPSSIEMAISTAWSITVSGSLLSYLLAAIVRFVPVKSDKNRMNKFE